MATAAEYKVLTLFLILDTFHINPQLQLHLTAGDTCVLSLSQHCVSEPQVSIITPWSRLTSADHGLMPILN